MHRGYEYRRNSVHAVLMRHGNVQGTLELYDQELLHASSSAQRGKLTIAATPYLASPFVQNTKRCRVLTGEHAFLGPRTWLPENFLTGSALGKNRSSKLSWRIETKRSAAILNNLPPEALLLAPVFPFRAGIRRP